MKTTYRIGGMTCGGCVSAVQRALERGGLRATVDLSTHSATIEGEHDLDQLRQLVEGAGFELGEVVTERHG